MCVVSMVGDHYTDKYDDWIREKVPNWPRVPQYPMTLPEIAVTREEFNAIKKDLEEMKLLLLRAIEYDKRNNEPHCEMDEKVALLKQLAKIFNVDLNDVFTEE